MHRTINIAALIYFIWLLLDAFNIPNVLLNFLLAGEIPGVKTALPPSAMMAILASIAVIILFEILARHLGAVQRIRQTIIGFATGHAPDRLNRA